MLAYQSAARNGLSVTVRVGTALLACFPAGGCNMGQRELEDTTPIGCAECHIDITNQWQQSAHSIAWTSPAFVERSVGHGEEYCLPCHASQPLLDQTPGEEPRLRDVGRQFGVDCNVCHQQGCEYVGPYKNLIEAHPTRQDAARLPCADFCGTCHRMEVEQYKQQHLVVAGSDRDAGCAGCHMSAYRSRLTQGHVLSYIHPKRTVRDHSFSVWDARVAGDAVEISEPIIRQSYGNRCEVRTTLVNRRAGHSIPVGEFGYHELLIRAELLAADESLLGAAEHSVFPGDNDVLRPGAPVEISLEIGAADLSQAVRCCVIVKRVNEDRSFSFTLGQTSCPMGAGGRE